MMVREGVAGGAIAGNIAALLSALGFATFTITLRWGKLANMLPAVVLGGLFSMVAGALVVGYQGGSLAIPAAEIAISAGMGAVTLAGGMVLYTIGSRVIPAAQATLLSLVEVLLAPIWVWAFLGETATAATFIGGAVLLVAVVLNALIGARERAQSGLVLT
jgi:drug/metabolite transporter (DMT)-like permease